MSKYPHLAPEVVYGQKNNQYIVIFMQQDLFSIKFAITVTFRKL